MLKGYFRWQIFSTSHGDREQFLEWQTGAVVPLFKKGNQRVCGNYKGITLLSLPGKTTPVWWREGSVRLLNLRLKGYNAILQVLYQTVVTKQELRHKEKLSNCQVLIPSLVEWYNCWTRIERTRLRIQEAEMGVLTVIHKSWLKRPRLGFHGEIAAAPMARLCRWIDGLQ